jgi:hypothetical protein
VADDYLLFFFPSAFNFDFFQITIPLTFTRYDHANLLPSSDVGIKKPAKKSFRVLAGIYGKPKRLFATFLI